MPIFQSHQNRAFSLVELSIVLVILGLLLGGILGGKSLIRASELRSISEQRAQFVTATKAFQDKYFALPGDMTNAGSFWGLIDPVLAACVTTTSATKTTCNGDGDSRIEECAQTDGMTGAVSYCGGGRIAFLETIGER